MSARATQEARGITINLRADERRRTLIDRAAQVLDAACSEATSVLLDQRFFLLDKKNFKRFTDALDKQPSENARLRRLLSVKAPWER